MSQKLLGTTRLQDSTTPLTIAYSDSVSQDFKVSSGNILNGPRWYENTTIDIGYAQDGSAPPAIEDVVTQTNGSIRARIFSHSSVQDVVIPWRVPDDIYASSGIKFKVHGIITSSTAPAAGEGVSFKLSGYSRGTGDSLTGTFGTEVEANITDLDAVGVNAQYDLFSTAYSGTVTITDLAVGELVMLHFERDTADSDDDYAQDVGVIGITIQWTRQLPAS